MGRETLLVLLLVLLGGVAVQPLAAWRLRNPLFGLKWNAERRTWLQLWVPVLPALVIGAWLCGWALREPDPVGDPMDRGLLAAACLPFALIAARALFRACWALVRESASAPICTAGFLKPRIFFSPFLAKTMKTALVRAAWEHEKAHVRHYDPLRIWLAQIATDLQWPWPGARERFDRWLEALELARDEEARRHGASGHDLAAALLAAIRHSSPAARAGSGGWASGVVTDASLVGDTRALQRRIARLLTPLPEQDESQAGIGYKFPVTTVSLVALLAATCVLGAIYGEHFIRPLLAWTR